MYQGVIMSGFGGQGVISAGIILAYAGMTEGKYVTFFPAYGAEMRGGTANCSVIVSDQEIAAPIVSTPDSLIVMNEPSLARFELTLKPKGLLLINSSLVSGVPKRGDLDIQHVPANSIAEEVGTIRCANMVMLGALAKRTGVVKLENIIGCLPKVFTKAKKEILDINAEAIRRGAQS